VQGKMVTGAISDSCLGHVPGQNKVPVTIFPSQFWRCFSQNRSKKQKYSAKQRYILKKAKME